MQALRQQIKAAGARQLQQALESWLSLVGSLGGRMVYALD
jgi:hypothetical protein